MAERNRVVVRDFGLQRLLARIMRPDRGYATVGVHAKEGDRDTDEMTNADIARIHEFGAPAAKIPQRSFIRSTVAKEKSRYKALLRTGAKAVALGRLSQRQLIEVVATRMSQDMVNTIDRGIEPELSEQTIERKKSSKPLIDTGQLKRSITHVYHAGNKGRR